MKERLYSAKLMVLHQKRPACMIHKSICRWCWCVILKIYLHRISRNGLKGNWFVEKLTIFISMWWISGAVIANSYDDCAWSCPKFAKLSASISMTTSWKKTLPSIYRFLVWMMRNSIWTGPRGLLWKCIKVYNSEIAWNGYQHVLFSGDVSPTISVGLFRPKPN